MHTVVVTMSHTGYFNFSAKLLSDDISCIQLIVWALTRGIKFSWLADGEDGTLFSESISWQENFFAHVAS